MKSKSPLVSVVVPVYNVENYVEKCLKSLLGQDYETIEILVVDDGSTDESGRICDEISLSDTRIKVFHKENGGLSSARNYGIRRANGEYVCLVDSDDAVQESFVRDLVEVAENKNADVVICGYNGNVPMPKMISGENAAIRLLVGQENMEIIAWNKLYRKYLFDTIKYPEGENYEDCLTTYKFLAEARGVAYLAKSLYIYEEREGSITKSDDKIRRLLAREKAAEEAILYFQGRTKLKRAAEVALLTAKYAFLDFAINGEISRKYGRESRKWISENYKKYKKNPLMTEKLKVYNFMVTKMGGVLYKVFRKIRHE